MKKLLLDLFASLLFEQYDGVLMKQLLSHMRQQRESNPQPLT